MRFLIILMALFAGCVDEQEHSNCEATCYPYLVWDSNYAEGMCLCDMRFKMAPRIDK